MNRSEYYIDPLTGMKDCRRYSDGLSKKDWKKYKEENSIEDNIDISELPFSSMYDKIKPNYRYNEDKYLEELKKYIDATYSAHYRAETNELQCIDVWFSLGSALTSCRDVIMKYLWRVGKKGSKEEHRKDLMKVMHYAMFCLEALDRQKD